MSHSNGNEKFAGYDRKMLIAKQDQFFTQPLLPVTNENQARKVGMGAVGYDSYASEVPSQGQNN